MFNFFNRKKDSMLDAFLEIESDQETKDREALSSAALLNNPHFEKAVAEYRYELMQKEDYITQDPTLTSEESDRYRRYYSELRVLLSGLIERLDGKIFESEEGDHQPDNKE